MKMNRSKTVASQKSTVNIGSHQYDVDQGLRWDNVKKGWKEVIRVNFGDDATVWAFYHPSNKFRSNWAIRYCIRPDYPENRKSTMIMCLDVALREVQPVFNKEIAELSIGASLSISARVGEDGEIEVSSNLYGSLIYDDDRAAINEAKKILQTVATRIKLRQEVEVNSLLRWEYGIS